MPSRRLNLTMFVAMHSLICVNFVFYALAVGFNIFLCTPRQKIWNPFITDGHCLSQEAVYKSAGIYNPVSDLLILLLPLSSIYKLRLPLKRKIGLWVVFGIGFV